MNTLRMPDSPVMDDLEVDAALRELGMGAADLDRELAIAESARTILLASLWEPEPGLEERIEARVAQRLQYQETAWMLADLAVLGWSTLRAVIDNERPRHHGGTTMIDENSD